ncbi:hypothetical protein SEA_GHOBES_48 [Gordonia phage Ghobes]|uniref:Uncharacterized protein n=1 Tax=Gordonia phage Ghobes TaxID=1887647 RepID=A0A1B3B080_9CAUD|nr:hypothetical protein KCH37_gp48 [Gordonia phage Ghobes]AOE44399.1 hypothetical protein SEA_GHOBES_48 [Gordonia phage Ghobes]
MFEEVVGRNFRQLRLDRGLTHEAVSLHAQALGLPWTCTRVASFESGKVELKLQTLDVLVRALASASGKAVRQEDLFESLPGFWSELGVAVPEPVDTDSSLGLLDYRVAKKLGRTGAEVADAAHKLWGRSLRAERNRLAPENANDHQLGTLTRRLTEELRKELEN